jgi:hypothetical protein
MAAKTPDSVAGPFMLGNARLMVLKFVTENLDNADTVATGIPNLANVWFQPTAAFASSLGLTVSGETITVAASDDNQTGYLFCLSQG